MKCLLCCRTGSLLLAFLACLACVAHASGQDIVVYHDKGSFLSDTQAVPSTPLPDLWRATGSSPVTVGELTFSVNGGSGHLSISQTDPVWGQRLTSLLSGSVLWLFGDAELKGSELFYLVVYKDVMRRSCFIGHQKES